MPFSQAATDADRQTTRRHPGEPRFATFAAPAYSSPFFKDQPRLHMVQELCEMQLPSKPVLTGWYREEDFGGSVVSIGRVCGGRRTTTSNWTANSSEILRTPSTP